MGLEMEENNTELEEGEASCYYKDDEENVDRTTISLTL